MAQCAICLSHADPETAPILTMSGYGNPRYLCPDCERDVDLATTSESYEEATAAMDRLSAKVTRHNSDKQTVETVTVLLADAAVRARSIADGTYTPEADESAAEDGFDEIPEDMLETAEDVAAEERDAEKLRKFDKVFNWIAGIVFGAAALILVWRILDAYLF